MAIFAKVIDCGAFSRAAKELSMTTSAVSQHIRQLENTLKIQLIHRSTRALSLTEAGAIFYKDCRQMVEAAKRGEQRLAALRSELVGDFRIATSTEFAIYYLVPALKNFLDAHPLITLWLEINDAKEDLIAQRIDLSIRGGKMVDSSFVSTRILHCREVLCASPDYCEKYGMPVSLSDLTYHQWVIFTPLGNPQRIKLISPVGEVHHINITGRIFTDNAMVIKSLALSGRGVTRNLFVNVEKELNNGELVEILPGWRLPGIYGYALIPRRENQPLKVRVFLEYMKTYLERNGCSI